MGDGAVVDPTINPGRDACLPGLEDAETNRPASSSMLVKDRLQLALGAVGLQEREAVVPGLDPEEAPGVPQGVVLNPPKECLGLCLRR